MFGQYILAGLEHLRWQSRSTSSGLGVPSPMVLPVRISLMKNISGLMTGGNSGVPASWSSPSRTRIC